ncbi:hypothetical protein M407DRAFT_216420 [Tulasnella calospora MUT 4182]|uniref:Uncharacterized protein n=1 Tax=Tulasnella calospora MUT 4182 TaxID=1051891 RepID=A0A0C3QCQ7_9AGAM|nr:hypothetical protein M407DRAFT_216420 [Tulasnella calospora MUT 4182]
MPPQRGNALQLRGRCPPPLSISFLPARRNGVQSFSHKHETYELPTSLPSGSWVLGMNPSSQMGGEVTHSIHFEVIQAASGNRHNPAPRVNGVTLDYSKLVSFFDSKYKSLVNSREGVDRTRWRVGEISRGDVELFREELVEALSRKGEGSGVEWDAIIRNVAERHAGRLEFLSDWLGDSRENSTHTIVHTRRAVLTMLAPYLTRSISSIPSDYKTNTTNGHEGNLSYPRVIWVDAFDAEELHDEEKQRKLIAKWTAEVKSLMDWLGWAEWVKCKPACRPYWPYDAQWMDPELEISYTPKCMSRIEQDPGGPEWLY